MPQDGYITVSPHASYGVSNHCWFECLFNSLLKLATRKYQIYAMLALFEGNRKSKDITKVRKWLRAMTSSCNPSNFSDYSRVCSYCLGIPRKYDDLHLAQNLFMRPASGIIQSGFFTPSCVAQHNNDIENYNDNGNGNGNGDGNGNSNSNSNGNNKAGIIMIIK